MHNEHTKTIKEAINFIERAINFEDEIAINYKFFRSEKKPY